MKKNRNLLYPLPISEVSKEKQIGLMEFFIGRKIEKINIDSAAEYAGVVNAFWELRNIEPISVNGRDIDSATLAAYVTGIPESLSFAFRGAHGVQRFDIEEIGKGKTSNKKFLFSVTDVEFYEKHIVLFGIVKDKETNIEKEYLVYWFLDTFEFYSSDIQVRKLRNRVIFNLSNIESRRLTTILKYAYRYLKYSDEVKLSKLTELLTKEQVKKPGRQMFIALNKILKEQEISNECKDIVLDVLNKSFHRFVQTSREKTMGLLLQDSEGVFQLSMEEIIPCPNKKGLRCQGLREYIGEPWKNHNLNIEYDYKKNEFFIYDKEWTSQIGVLTYEETLENLMEIKNFRRCINVFYNSRKIK